MPERPEKVYCMGCGRRVDVRGLSWWDWFRCASCGRVHILRARLAKFVYDERHERTERRKTISFVTIAFALSFLGGWLLTQRMGRPLLVYGVEVSSAGLVSAVAVFLNRRTRDILLVAGVLSAMLTLRRIGLHEMVLAHGAQDYTGFPWAMIWTTVGCFALVAYQRRKVAVI